MISPVTASEAEKAQHRIPWHPASGTCGVRDVNCRSGPAAEVLLSGAFYPEQVSGLCWAAGRSAANVLRVGLFGNAAQSRW